MIALSIKWANAIHSSRSLMNKAMAMRAFFSMRSDAVAVSMRCVQNSVESFPFGAGIVEEILRR